MTATATTPATGLRARDELGALAAYEWMLRIRAFEERCLLVSQEGLAAGSMHLCAGQEAIPVGAVSVLGEGEPVIATYRGHGWAIACGVPLPDLLAEICQRSSGTNGGRAGSPYLSSPSHGFVGENSVVGAGVPIAAGQALALRRAGLSQAALVSIGDGAMNQGATHEGLVFAAAKKLPLVVVCENNGWSELTAIRDVVPLENLADRAAAYGMPGVVVDGCDPLSVRRELAAALDRARRGDGPTLVECKTVRLWGHYNLDIEHYRPAADKAAAAAGDPVIRMRTALLAEGVAEDRLVALEHQIEHELDGAVRFASESPAPDPATAADHVVSNVAVAPAPRLPRGGTEDLTFVLAVNRALRDELAARPDLLVFGEDVGVAGGVFGATRRLQSDFGADRVFDTPIAESSILGAAVGLGLAGYRPVAEIMWSDFLLVALDQLINQAANVRYLSRGEQSLPIVVRTQQGVTPGSCAQHSQSLEALLAHIPGLRVGLPATPQDAYSMLRAAIAHEDPCILIESRALYQLKGPVAPVADSAIGGARKYGTDGEVGIVTWGRMLHVALDAAAALREQGVAASVLDLRWLAPLDRGSLGELVDCCRCLIVLHEANLTGGFGAEVAAGITEDHFASLAAPVKRVAAPDVRFPSAPVLQAALLPGREAVVAAANELLRGARA